MGLQFAGEAAGLALVHVTSGENFARLIFSVLNPACTLGMLLIWIYAITRAPQAVAVHSRGSKQAVFLEAVAD